MRKLLLLIPLVLLITQFAQAQQDYVPRFGLYTAYSYLASPKLNLAQRGVDTDIGVNLKRWLSVGFDYSVFNGHSALVPADLTDALQMQLAATVPPGIPVSVPFDPTTQTFSAGPQINFRQLKYVTFFVRPALGALHEQVTAKPTDPLTTAIVTGLVGPGKKKSDTVLFYGFGGGFDINASKHVAIRVASDYVHTFLFEGLLREGRNTARISFGPSFRWGKSVE